MSNVFLSEGTFNLSSGTANIIGSAIGASNLLSGSTVKVNSNKQLYSSALAMTDVQGLTTALGGRLSNPSSVPVIAPSFVKSGGTSSQYLMADGSVTTGGIGATGPTGANGADGLSSSVFVYTFSTQTSGTPASGIVYLNDAPVGATQLYVSHLSKDGHDLDQILNNVSVNSNLIVQRSNDSNIFAQYTVTSKTLFTGYVRYDLTYVANTGTIGNNNEVLLIVQQAGPAGPQGIQGPTGANGGSTSLFDYKLDRINFNTTSMTSGTIRFNNADITLSTEMYVHYLTEFGLDWQRIISLFPTNSTVVVQDKATANYALFEISNFVVRTANQFITIPVSYIQGINVASLTDNMSVYLGNYSGTPGPQGEAGPAGQLYNNFQQFSYYGTTPTSLFFNMASGCFSILGGTVANATQASTNMLTRQYRTRQAPSSVADGQDAGWLGTAAVPVVYITGGWRYVYTFGIEDTTTNAPTRTMIGMTSSNTAPVLNAATAVTANTIPFFGICQDVGESTFSFYTRGASSFTKTSTLISCATPGALWYQITFENNPFSLDVTMTLTAYSTLASATATISFTAGAGSATLPNPTTTFFPLLIRAMCTPTQSSSAILSLGAIKMHSL